MLRPSSPSRSFWLTLLLLTFIANLAAALLSYARWQELGVNLFGSVWGLLAAAYLVALLVGLWLLIRIVSPGGFDAASRFKFFESEGFAIRALGWIVFLAILVLIPYLKFALRIGRDKNPLLVDPQ